MDKYCFGVPQRNSVYFMRLYKYHSYSTSSSLCFSVNCICSNFSFLTYHGHQLRYFLVIRSFSASEHDEGLHEKYPYQAGRNRKKMMLLSLPEIFNRITQCVSLLTVSRRVIDKHLSLFSFSFLFD